MTIGPTFEQLNAEEQERKEPRPSSHNAMRKGLVGDALREIVKYFSWKETCRFAVLSRMAASIIIPRMRRALVDGKLTHGEGGQFTYRLDVSKDGGKKALVQMEGNELKISLVEGSRHDHVLYRELSETVLDEGESVAAYNVHISGKVLTVEGVKNRGIVIPPGWTRLVVRAEMEVPT